MGNSVVVSDRIRGLILAVAAAVAVVCGLLVPTQSARADVSPADGRPATVTADSLPTVQINGIVWDQEIVGNTVFAVGSFSSARPAGAALGVSETPRSNILAYNLSTGVLITSFAPTVNAQIRQVEASPDGTRLYIVGDFTTVNGVARNRVAAFDLPSGTLSSFNPNANSAVLGVDATDTTVYLAGVFGRVSNNDRLGAAAVTRDGVLLPWAPVLGDRRGKVVLVSPDATKVVLGGSFPTLNGSSNPGYGLGVVDATTGALLSSPVNNVIRNGGKDASIYSLKGDGDSFYGSGYVFGAGGNLEGTFRADWATGSLTWVNDCHGDEYDVQPIGDVIYSVGHPHYCGSLQNGFPQSDPWTFYRGIATTKSVARITPFGVNLGYFDFGGNPAPELLHFFPTFNAGSVSGASQGPWSVTGNSQYVVYGGEFTRVNNVGQQGLTRFAVPSVSVNAQGPTMAGNAWVPSALAVPSGAVRLSWPSNWDRDSENLTYEVLRNNAVIYTSAPSRSKSANWGVPPFTYADGDVQAGASYTYRVRAKDNEGHTALSAAVTVTAEGSAAPSAYRESVLADSPLDYWPLDEASGAVAFDWAGASDLNVNSGVTRGTDGAIISDNRPGSSFDGTGNGFATTTTAIPGPDTFGAEAWFRTTTTSGGKILGFGNSSTGTSSSYDRHVYMEPDGRLTFGVYPGSVQTVSSMSTYNDGQWHHVVAGLGSGGMTLYVDGMRVAQRTDVTSGQGYSGYWRVGGDSPWSGNAFFAGQIDEVAIYAAPLTRDQVRSHYEASGRTIADGAAPSDAYGTSVYQSDPTLYWRMSDTAGSTAVDASGFNQSGNYIGALTRGVAGVLTGNSAVSFDGGQLISASSFTNPTVYSLEAWFKTTSTTGGKIIGFGDSGNGNSSNYDRHVYMSPSGQLVFGVWTGSESTIGTPGAYNDGQWHHVVATQGPSGMTLYVDGASVGTNPTNWAQNYTGHWHVGGDVTWGGGAWEFRGAIDEVAVYSSLLASDVVALHYAIGKTGEVPNQSPTAAFTSNASKLNVSVDASASTDADGAVAGYSWDWGDGSAPSTGVTSSHTYVLAGSYVITLTVTDDDGASGVLATTVPVVANQAPIAQFSLQPSALTVATSAADSSDIDGTITAYSWDWGDGSSPSDGVSATHTYAESGTYPITLSVTDNDGAVSSKTLSTDVTARDPLAPYARDDFSRTQASGLGDATLGGAWTLAQAAGNYLVDGSAASFIQQNGGAQRLAYLSGVSSLDTAVDVDVVLPQRPIAGSAYASVLARRVGALDYRSRIIVAPNGSVTAQIQQTNTTLASAAAGITVSAGDALHVRFEAVGNSPTQLRLKVWKVGTAEPTGWTLSAADSTAGLQAAGHMGLGVYLGGSVTNLPFSTAFDNLWVGPSAGGPLTQPNVAPTAAIGSSVTDLTASLTGTDSTDSDGTIASYAWDFGDGQSGTGRDVTHVYGAAGTFTVTLTVTDDDGATATAQATVTTTAPAVADFARDSFDRPDAASPGAADVGGAWASSAGVTVQGGALRLTSTTGGSNRTAYLSNAMSESSDLAMSFALPALPTTSSAYVSVIGRRIGADDYRARWVISATGAVQAQIMRTNTVLAWANVPSVTVAPGVKYNLRVQVTGQSPTTIQLRIWPAGSPEPTSWQVTTTDSTAALQGAGYVGVASYVGSTIAPLPFDVMVDDLTARRVN